MKRFILAVVLALAAGGVASAQGTPSSRSTERAFAPGGRVWMDLSAGDYRIRAGRGDRVLVEWTTSDPDDLNNFSARLEPKGPDLVVATKGPKGGMRIVIEVPEHSDLTVQLSAGDLLVEAVTGSKDIRSWAGDIVVEARPDDYRTVEASVTAGDLSARPFNVSKGGLFRSFSWQGKGRYDLKVRLTAGDLVLR